MRVIRKCGNCSDHLPPETEHVYSDKDDEVYCMDCVEVVPYTEKAFYVAGEWIGSTGDESCKIIEDYEDEYEEQQK